MMGILNSQEEMKAAIESMPAEEIDRNINLCLDVIAPSECSYGTYLRLCLDELRKRREARSCL